MVFLFKGNAQNTVNPKTVKKEGKVIEVKHAASLTYDRSKSDARFLTGNVIFEHDGALLNCDTALLYEGENKLEASGHILITKGDSIRVTGEKLFYSGATKMATLERNVRCVEKDMILTTNLLTFDVGNSIANYYEGGTIVNKDNTLTSKNGHYYSATKELAFHYDVELVNPDYKMKSDTLRYNTVSKTAYFLGPSIIISKDDYIYCENGWYDTENEKSQFSRNAVLVTKNQKLRGDSLLYDRNLKMGRAFNNIQLIDTSQKSIIYGNYAIYYQEKSEATITDKPIYARMIEKDTLFIAADTLYHRDLDSVDNFLNAYHHVRLYKKDIQALCDSAVLNTKDSLLQLIREPLLWAEKSQAKAKFMHIFIGKNSVKGFKMDGNSFLIQQSDSLGKYNQLLGKSIEGFIADDTIRKIIVKGNAEILYYPLNDKKKPIGLNKTSSSEITLWFQKGEIERASFKPKSEGKIDPIKDVDVQNAQLKGFTWLYEKRPKGRFDLHLQKSIPEKEIKLDEKKPEVMPVKKKKKK